jgi:DNA-binding response OmpR family regulator
MRILLAEWDTDMRTVVRERLGSAGFEVVEARTAAEVRHMTTGGTFDAVVMNVEQESDLVAAVRDAVPGAHVIVTGAAGVGSRVRVLREGADDYVEQPYAAAEIVARLEAVRRKRPEQPAITRVGDVVIDRRRREVRRSGAAVVLTRREFDLLAHLVARPGEAWSRHDLLRTVWGSSQDWQSPTTVTEHIRRLRSKLGDIGIEGIRGFGYRFAPPPPQPDDVAFFPEAVIVVRVDDLVVQSASAAAADLLGLDPYALAGRNALDFIAPTDVEVARRRQAAVAAGGSPPPQPLNVRLPDGRTRRLLMSSTSLSGDDGVCLRKVNLWPDPDQLDAEPDADPSDIDAKTPSPAAASSTLEPRGVRRHARETPGVNRAMRPAMMATPQARRWVAQGSRRTGDDRRALLWTSRVDGTTPYSGHRVERYRSRARPRVVSRASNVRARSTT